MSTVLLEKPENVKELVDNALDSQTWKDHLEKG